MKSLIPGLCRQLRPPRSPHRRTGAVLVAALVCLAIVITMLGAMLLAAVRMSRQAHTERDLRQCEWLLDAGLNRALFRFAKEPAYRGETWTLPAAAIIGSADGQVTIEVDAGEAAKPPELHVTAEYPLGGEGSIRRSHTILLPIKSPTAQE